MKACLKTNSRLAKIDEFRNINEETANIILVTIFIVMIIGTCCLLQSREILCAKKPGQESNKCMQCWEHVDPPRVETVGSDEEEAPAEHQASLRNMQSAQEEMATAHELSQQMRLLPSPVEKEEANIQT